MKRLTALICLLGLLFAGCVFQTAEPTHTTAPPTTVPATTQPTEPPPTETTVPPDPVEQMMEQMTLREKVGQLFFVAPEALVPEEAPVRACSDALTQALETYPVGGIILFADHLSDPEQLSAFTQALQQSSKTGLFLGVDEEGGPVARLANHWAFDLPKYWNAASVGASGNPEDALSMGHTIGGYLREYGFNVDFAPVADVNTNPYNPVIGNRAFSSDPAVAAQMAAAMAQGLRERDITPVFKHFPGHGDTAEDSHNGLAVSYKTAEQMRSCEWIPFREAGAEDWIMVGHVAVPEITGDRTPATLSASVVTGILRQELGFEGLIITDSMAMGAITQAYSSGEAALGALEAGCDMVLMPQDLAQAFDAVVAAVENGTFPQERLEETVYRILRFKAERGIVTF